MRCTGCGTGTWDGYTGWVSGWVIPGHPATQLPRAKGGPSDSEAGPVGLQGRSGWSLGPEYHLVRPSLRPHHSRPCRPSGPAPLGLSLSSGKGRDSRSILIKLVKTAKCHRKVFKRPVIVPNLQNGLKKSPLDFPGFPFYVAFSHKELMGLFRPYGLLYCQNDEVSTVCTPRERVVRYPLRQHCRRIPHLTQREQHSGNLRVFSTSLDLLGN